MKPLVSVITPTWQRHDWLINRCIASVQKQTYPAIEQIVVSDGPDPELALMLSYPELDQLKNVTYRELPVHSGEKWGVRGRLRGLELAKGEFIAYLDDDDAYRPEHCELLAKVLMAYPGVGLVYSQMASHGAAMGNVTVVGSEKLGPCAIGTPMMMHRRELLELATWGPPDPMEDWRLVDRWLECGVQAKFVDRVTVDVWPSTYRGE